jgi:AraC-like DNA-binding protein
MPVARVPTSLFQTHALHPNQRFCAWRESISVIFDVTLPCSTLPENFGARVESYLVGDVMLARCTASAQHFSRSLNKIAEDSIDHYMVQLFISGTVEMERNGRLIQGHAGRIVTFDCGEVLDSTNSDFDLLSVFVPRRRLSPLLLRPDVAHGLVLDPESAATRILTNFYMDIYRNAPLLTPGDGQVMADTLIQLMAQALNGERALQPEPHTLTAKALILRVQTYIRENLTAPDLTPAAIAQALGLSRSTLYRLFEQHGGVGNYVREQRLRWALKQLLSTHGTGLNISRIAYGAGFNSLSHFTRAFRDRFACTPSDVRAGLRPLGRIGNETFSGPCGDRHYEDWIACLV